MSCNPIDTQKLNSLHPVYCSVTAKFVVAEVSQRFDIPNGQVTWFQCEACHGWHIVIDNQYPENMPPRSDLGNDLNLSPLS